MSLRIIDMRTPDGPGQLRSLNRGPHLARFRGETEQALQVRKIIEDVADKGDTAVIEYTKKFDCLELSADNLRVSTSELAAAKTDADPRFMEAMRRAIGNVRSYQERIEPKSLPWEQKGIELGIRFEAIERVGVYAPGGKAVYPSSVVMSVVPAQVAGVKEIVVCCSPGLAGKVDANMLAVCAELDVDEVYQIGGAQAIAAMALGTETITPPVDKIVGPGNLYVQLAKKQLYGQIDIDSFAGPSEVLIIADETAPADYIAADLLAQAEHDPGSARLVTNSERLAKEVVEAVEKELQTAGRAEAIRESLEQFSAAVLVSDMDEAIKEANDFAPEHLQVMVAEPDKIIDQIKNAGAIFVGQYTPVALGDYYAGPSHVLPTSGTARAFSGLSVYDFLKRMSLISYEAEALQRAAEDVQVLAKVEGLDMHGRSVSVRLENKQQ